jgi:hypothetical protein
VSKQKTTRAKTSRSLPIFIVDTSSTTGGGLSGVTSASSGLVLEYRRQNQSAWTSVTPQSGKTLGTYFSGGIVASGSLAGRYEVDFPDAAFASAAGVEWVELCVRGVANMLPVLIEIELDAVDYQDAAAFGLSRIDATIGSRATQTSVDTIDDFIDTEVIAIKNKTDLIVAFPANFGSLGITAGGAIAELGANALQANDLYTPISQAVWNALTTTTWVADSFGKYILISNNNNRSVQVTGAGSGHVAADIHALQAGVITSAAFAANWLTAAGLAADAVGEIADGVWDEATSGHTTAGTTGKALIDSGAAGNPWSTDLATGYSGTQAGNILNQVKGQTDLITAGGTVNVTSPVTATGQLASPLIIGDDYLAANGRRFRWTVALPSGYVIATSTARFGMRYEDDEGVNSFIATGTVTDATGGNVHLDFDVAKTVTGTLRPGWYEWSVEIVSGSGVEITRVKSGKNVEWQEKQT